jgi:hypothetical protein
VGLLRLTLTRRRLDIFAEIGAVEVVKGAATPPTPGQKRGGEPPSGGIHAPPERACPVEGGGGRLDRPLLKNFRVNCRLSVLKILHHVRGLAAKVDVLRLNPP